MSSKPRPERRRASRTATRKTQTKPRPAAPRRPASPRRPAGPSLPAARSRGAGFLDYLIIALLIVLAVMLVAGLLIVLRVL